jgi:hypothetical protein
MGNFKPFLHGKFQAIFTWEISSHFFSWEIFKPFLHGKFQQNQYISTSFWKFSKISKTTNISTVASITFMYFILKNIHCNRAKNGFQIFEKH